jgi:hypothetical protein
MMERTWAWLKAGRSVAAGWDRSVMMRGWRTRVAWQGGKYRRLAPQAYCAEPQGAFIALAQRLPFLHRFQQLSYGAPRSSALA